MQKTHLNIITYFWGILFLFSGNISCKDTHDNIPTVYVDIQIDLTDPLYFQLRNIGSYVYITGGVNGIILYRASADEFKAYERTCPHDPDCGIVSVDAYNFEAVDDICCESEFSLIIDGAVTNGPSEFPLRSYYVSYNENLEILRITN